MFRKAAKSAGTVNVKDFGAVGNGEKDDTEAIRKARNIAVANNKALYFPAGTYMIHGCIELWSGCEIYGEGSKTIVRKISAITQFVHTPKNGFTLGQTTFTVADATKYTVGHDCCVNLNWPNIGEGLYGKIKRIDGNSITVHPYLHRKTVGLNRKGVNSFNSYPEKVVFSSSFPVFCTYRYTSASNDNSVHDVYIHDLTIDGNRQGKQKDTYAEPCPYTLSAINISDLTYQQSPDNFREVINPNENIRMENLNIYNSPSDGISIQSSKNVYITNCITDNCGFNGVHLGVGTDNVSIIGCKLNADYCGYFDCADVGTTSLVGNHFEKCRYGIGGLDQYTNGLAITGNTFRGCSVGICAGLLPNPQQISYLNDATKGYGYLSRASSGVIISNNAFYGTAETLRLGDEITVTRTGVGITSLGGTSFIINGNSFHHLNSAIELGCAQYIRIANNYIRDCDAPLSMVEGSREVQMICAPKTCDSAFTGNTVQTGAAGASAKIIIRYAQNFLVTDNIVIGADAGIEIGDDAQDVTIENNIVSGTT